MNLYLVKLTFNYDWPLFRQLPGDNGVWGNYKFVIDPYLKECDFWIIYTEHGIEVESCICSPHNVFFIPAEGFDTSINYEKNFLRQFALVLTVQRELKGNNSIYGQNAMPWFLEKSYDELINLKCPAKTKLLSVISSDKQLSLGHKKRITYVKKIQKYFGSKIDVFGRGINEFQNKWDVTAPYKFQIVIENDFCIDYVSEKFFDSILSFTYPIYFGCPNLSEIISQDQLYTRIDINNFDESIDIIENLINNDNLYQDFLLKVPELRNNYLNNLQLFPTIVQLISKYGRFNQSKRKVKIYSNDYFIGNLWVNKTKKIVKTLLNITS